MIERRKSLRTEMLQGTGLYLLAIFAPKLVSMLLLPVYTRFLGPADYGRLDLLDQASNVLALLLGANFCGALFYFYAQAGTPEAKGKAAATNIWGSLAIGVVFALLGLALGRPLSGMLFGSADNYLLFPLAFATIGLNFFIEAVQAWLRAMNRPRLFTIIALGRLVLTATCALTLVAAYGMGMIGVVASNLVASSVLASALGVYVYSQLRTGPDVTLFGEMVTFYAPMAAGSLAVFCMHFADRFFLSAYVSMSEIGLYSVAYKFGMLVAFLHSGFHQYWGAQVYGILRRDDHSVVLVNVFSHMTALLAWAALALAVMAQPVLAIATTPAYATAAATVPLVALAYLVRACGDFFRVLLVANRRPAWDAVCNWVGAVVCLVAYALLIPAFGVWGAAMATVAGFSSASALAYLLACRLLPLGEFAGIFFKTTAPALVLGLAARVAAPATLADQWTVAAVTLTAYPGILWILRLLPNWNLGGLESARDQAAAQGSSL